MTKSNLIAVDFRPQARLASLDELSARLDAIDAALAAAYARACEVEAEIKARDPDRALVSGRTVSVLVAPRPLLW
jgi:hypothetical protein